MSPTIPLCRLIESSQKKAMHCPHRPLVVKFALFKFLCVIFVFCAAMAIASPGQTLTTLANFQVTNGAWPAAPLIQGADGNFYGTTQVGGNPGTFGFCNELPATPGGCGIIFKVTPAGILTTLYAFCAQTNCLDGSLPAAGLVQGPDGYFYGTTVSGGANDNNCQYGCGTVFKITPAGALTTIYSFCSLPDCADGASPHAGLVLGRDGNFYGTTWGGGGPASAGTVFKITPQGALTTLYAFHNSGDGNGPETGLVQAVDGSFYGTTEYGGGWWNGSTVFKITPVGGFTSLHDFDGTDGEMPQAALIQATDGNLYGTTTSGGANQMGGTVFKITPGGTLTTLYSFCSQSNCADGESPVGGLVQATDGKLYGTTSGGGGGQCLSGCGTIFRITTAGALTTLHDFDYADGAVPSAALLQATDGYFYGTTLGGGNGGNCQYGCGTVFRLNVGLAPFVETQPTSGQVGTPVTILGTDLRGATGVTFNGTPAPINSNTGSAITTTVPAGATTGSVQVTTLSGTLTSNTDFQVTGPLQFVPVTPCRLLDTRQGNPILGGTMQSFTIQNLNANGPCGSLIPTNAAAYSLNVSVVPRGPLGYLTIWPQGEIQPFVATLNSLDGRIKGNAAIVPGGNNAVSVYVTDTTDVILDINGYFAAAVSGSLQFYSLTPCRVVDTRDDNMPDGLGPPALVGQQARAFPVLSSSCLQNLPQQAVAYSFSAAVVPNPPGQPLDYLTLYPSNQLPPYVSTLNNPTATVVANAALVQADPANGNISAFAYNSTDLVIDVNGYFAAPGGQNALSLYPVTPCRAFDTRTIGSGQPFQGVYNDPNGINVTGSSCAPPASAQAFVLNATVVPSGVMPYLTLWPQGTPQPYVSTLNAYDGAITNDMAIVPTNNGSIEAYAAGLTQLILDISGY